MDLSGEAPTQPALPISEDDLIGLRPKALLALEVRAVWRVLPKILEMEGRAAAGLPGILALAGLRAIDEAQGIDLNLPHANAPSSVPDPIYRWLLEMGRSLAEPLVGEKRVAQSVSFFEALSRYRSELAEDNGVLEIQFRLGFDRDLENARTWTREPKGSERAFLAALFRVPLWGELLDDKWSESLSRVLQEWDRGLGDVWMQTQFYALVFGKGLDIHAHKSALSKYWSPECGELSFSQAFDYDGGDTKSSSVDKQSKTAKKRKPQTESQDKATKPSNPAIPPEITSPSGGIVTAAADTPALDDRLGRTPLVQTLADMLCSLDQVLPMTIALLGDWGSGKSSVVAQLRKRLDEIRHEEELRNFNMEWAQTNKAGRKPRARYLYAEFNAWEYEQTDNLRAGLAQEVVNGLTEGLTRWEKLALAMTKAAKGNTLEFGMTLGGLVLVLLGLMFGVDLATPEEGGDMLKAAGMLSGGGVLAFSAYLMLHTWRTGRRLLEHPLATQMATYLKLPSYGKHLGEVPVIKREIRELCEERLSTLPNGRLLVVVDDLDRCHPDAVIETLDAIRLVMNLPQVVVIVAVDDRIAFRAVADHYAKLSGEGRRSKEEIARDYLGKIIQLPVNLYEPKSKDVNDFIATHLFKVNEAAPPVIESGEVGEVASRAGDAGKVVELPNPPSEGMREGAVQEGGEAPLSGLSDVRPKAPSKESEAEHIRKQQQVAEAAAAAREKLLADTPQERDLFAKLAELLRISNPRQLIRLHNSYRLLKGYRYSSGHEVAWPKLEKLMHCLFWYESLYQMKLSTRQHAELVFWLWPEKAKWHETAVERGMRNPALVQMVMQLHQALGGNNWASEYGSMMRTVDLVVLPNAQMGLLLAEEQVQSALKAQSKELGGEASPDPWGDDYQRKKIGGFTEED